MIARHQGTARLNLVEATVSDLLKAMQTGLVTSEELVGMYHARVGAYESAGPAVNAFIHINADAPDDAFIAAKLREAGIMGKATLPGSRTSSRSACRLDTARWGALDSIRTIPEWTQSSMTGRPVLTTGGSSSGSGISVNANFVAAAFGTETSGSILSPASANGVVGIKPTVGLVSRDGIIPITADQDTAGPIARTVTDAAIMLRVRMPSSAL